MDYLEIVSSVGFPIFCCVLLMKSNNETLLFFKDFSNDMNKSIDNNTKALTELITMLKGGGINEKE